MNEVTIALGGLENFEDVMGLLAHTGAQKINHRTFAVPVANLTPLRIAALLDLTAVATDEDITITGLDLTPEQRAAADFTALDKADTEIDADAWWTEHHG